MDNTAYGLVNLNDRGDLLMDLAKFEGELAKKIGQDVVLIAYTRNAKK